MRARREDRANQQKKEIAVLQLDRETDEVIAEFKSAAAAAVETGVCASNVTRVCRGREGSTGGYHWQYKHQDPTSTSGASSSTSCSSGGGDDDFSDGDSDDKGRSKGRSKAKVGGWVAN